jgi:hypothetical protein
LTIQTATSAAMLFYTAPDNALGYKIVRLIFTHGGLWFVTLYRFNVLIETRKNKAASFVVKYSCMRKAGHESPTPLVTVLL